MGRKKRKANKKKRRNLNTTKSNSNELKSSPTKSADSNAISPHPSDLEISDSDDFLSTASSQENLFAEAGNWKRNHFEESNTDSTPMFESSTNDAENFSIKNKASISGLTLTSRKERKVTEYDCLQTPEKTNASNTVPIARTENNESEISSIDGKVGSLNKATVDSDCPVFLDTPRGLIVFNPESWNNINSRCIDSADPSTSVTNIDKEDLQSPCPLYNSAVSLAEDGTDSQNQPNSKGNGRLNCSLSCVNNASVTIIETKCIGNAIPLTDDDVESLNNITIDFLSQDAIDCLESITFINANNVLESLNNNDLWCRNSTDPSASKDVINKGNKLYPIFICDKSSVSLTDVIGSQNKFILYEFIEIKRSSSPTFGGKNEFQASTKQVYIKVFSSNNSYNRKNASFHSESPEVCSLDSSSFINKQCENVLMRFIKREVELHQNILRGHEWISLVGSWLEDRRSYIQTKFQSRYFRKIERNACIKNMYTQKRKEFFECLENYEHLVNDISHFCKENFELQLRKLTDTLEKYEEWLLNSDDWFYDENFITLKNALNAEEYMKVKQLDSLRVKYLNKKIPSMTIYMKQIHHIISTFFENI